MARTRVNINTSVSSPVTLCNNKRPPAISIEIEFAVAITIPKKLRNKENSSKIRSTPIQPTMSLAF